MTPYRIMTAALLGGLALASAAQAQDAARGKLLFATECSACHSVMPGQNGIGPSLANVYGMHSASQPGFNYSPAMRTANVVWTDDELAKFLMNPDLIAAGSKMPQPGTEMHMGVPSAQDRGDLIAYLRSLNKG
ncbi:cytochrome c family protein [Acidocella sp. KAb 2-4]|uniref:c-type cytochrome n=1 Tax=Acidocella sp. KAb 2-4 TaxID=2885158 RepID=UPI001D06272C|nr:c-type cytochrome [Acidocella sp. KAb 2-4]